MHKELFLLSSQDESWKQTRFQILEGLKSETNGGGILTRFILRLEGEKEGARNTVVA